MWRFIFAVAQQATEGLTNAPGATPAAPATTGTGPAGTPACGPEAMGSLLPFILIFVVMWLLLLWPRQKQEKERQRMLKAVKKGDMVVTIGGVFGTVESLTENNVVLRVDKNVTMQFLRSAVASVVPPEGEKK